MPSALQNIGMAAVASLAVAGLGSLTWGPLLVANALTSPQVPWCIPLEAIALILIWLYLNGRWWPRSTSVARHDLLRAHVVPLSVFFWAALVGGLALVALTGLWIVMVELTASGGNPTLPGADQYPAVLVAMAIVMGSLVSPISEEAAFRGYGQVLLERSFRPITAVALSSAFFALYHGPTQGFAPSKLLFYFVVGVVFGAIACRTNSVLPALPVHVAGDLVFFTLIWPQDATRPLVWRDGADLVFWLNVAQLIVFGTLALVAFSRLRKAHRVGLRK